MRLSLPGFYSLNAMLNVNNIDSEYIVPDDDARDYVWEKWRRLYSKALPRVLPIATYSVCGEKSTAVTVPRGVPDVGQLAKTVRESK